MDLGEEMNISSLGLMHSRRSITTHPGQQEAQALGALAPFTDPDLPLWTFIAQCGLEPVKLLHLSPKIRSVGVEVV